MNASRAIAIGGLLSTLVAGCGGSARLSVADGTGPQPILPPPEQSTLPVINVVDATPWSEGSKPHPAEGLTVEAFARDLNHPRWLYVLPNGDVLVAETNAPPRPDEGQGVRGWFFTRYQKKAGGAPPSANRITLLRDADGDGIAEMRSVLIDSLTSPFGMALIDTSLFIANTDALVWVPYASGDLSITALPTTLVALPRVR